MYSGFTPRMISTPDPRFRLTLQSGQSMQRSLNPFEPIMTPIGDLSHEYGQRYNVYGTPIPYHASNMQGSLNSPGTVTVSATSTAVSSSINTTRSVAFATPRRQPTSSWERFLTDVFPDPLANYRYEYRDGTTQTCSNRLNGLTNPARYVPTSSNPIKVYKLIRFTFLHQLVSYRYLNNYHQTSISYNKYIQTIHS